MGRNKPYTASDFFETVMKEIEVPGYIDYVSSSDKPTLLKYYEFEVHTEIMYGGSEGVYLDIVIKGRYDEEMPSPYTNLTIGTIKTLDSSDEAIYKLYQLAAEIFIKANRFVQDNIDDFTWLGYRVKIKPEDNCAYEIYTTERIVEKLYQLKKWGADISRVSITDLSIKKEIDARHILKEVKRKEEEANGNN